MIDELNDRFGISDQLVFSLHPSGLAQGAVTTNTCTGQFFLLGAHVSRFQPIDQASPVLFMSSESMFQQGKPIRGGVPICFPWFGAHKTNAQAPAHGLARIANWEVLKSEQKSASIAVVLGLTVGTWKLAYTASFGKQLELSLAINNEAKQPQECEVALHTYFQLSNAKSTQVRGLESVAHLDKLTNRTVPATGEPITFTEETDRIYSGPVESVTIEDPGFARNILIRPRNSRSTVVWNPWIAKSQRMPDFGDLEYLHMCCVETANTAPNQLSIAPGQQHSIAVSIGVRNHCG